jgi:Uma2 family endonuclease
MTARAELIDREGLPREEDHYVHLHGVTWADYERILKIRGDKSAPRITYLEGTLEIMSPSLPHDSIKSTIGRLVEVWCLEHDIEFLTAGSWTVKNKRKKRGVEPDECYVFSGFTAPKRPDLAIEVVWTSGGIDKLDVYRKLGVPEVWYWDEGAIQVYRLRGERYVRARASVALRGIDLVELASFLDRPTTSGAIRDYRAALGQRH